MEFFYDSLLNLINNNNIFIKKIVNSYIKLINQLSNTAINNPSEFIKNLNLINNSGIIYIAFINNVDSDEFKIIASGTCYIEPKIIHNFKNVGHIEDIVVDIDFRGKGLIHNILTYLKNYAKNNNCYKIILDCHESLIKVYSKSDYEIKGVQMAIYF